MKISICITLFNSEKYYPKIISWINNYSTFFEFIIIDDATKDFKSSNFYTVLSNKVLIISNDFNKGVSYGRNQGILHSKSDYILFVDSDDDIDFKVLFNISSALNSDITVFNFKKNNQTVIVDRNFDIYSESLFNPVWNKIYNLKFLVLKGIKFNEFLFVGEDLDFNLRVFDKAIISFSKEIYYYYNESVPNSLSKSFTEKSLKSSLYLFELFNKNLKLNLYFYKDLHIIMVFNLWKNSYSLNLYKKTIISTITENLNIRYLKKSLKLIKNSLRIKIVYLLLYLRLFFILDALNYVKKIIL